MDKPKVKVKLLPPPKVCKPMHCSPRKPVIEKTDSSSVEKVERLDRLG